MIRSAIVWSPETFAAIAAWVQTVVLVVTAGFVWRQVRHAKEQIEEARAVRREQARPLVVVDFDVDSKPPFVFLTLENLGQTMATNVLVQFQPPLSSALFDRYEGLVKPSFFADEIPSLPPCKRLSALLDSFPDRKPRDLPTRFDVIVRYGQNSTESVFEDTYVLDLSRYLYKGLPYLDFRSAFLQLEVWVGRLRLEVERMGRWAAPLRWIVRPFSATRSRN
jgi:hypothetical protein